MREKNRASGRLRRITHPDAATTNNVRTGRLPARLANFISLSGQALNFGASIIALVCALRARCNRRSSSSYITSSHPPLCVHTGCDDRQYRDAPSLRYSLRQFDGFHFGSHAIVSLLPLPLRGENFAQKKNENAPRLVSTVIKVNPLLVASWAEIALLAHAWKHYVKCSIEHKKIFRNYWDN